MLGAYRLLFLTICFVSQSWGRLSVTVMERDYSHDQPSEVLVSHIRRVLDSMGALRVTLHPRVRHLYELLRRDAHLRSDYAASLRNDPSLRNDSSLRSDQSLLSEHGARAGLRNEHIPAAKFHTLDFHKTLRPKYDVYKINRIFTTEANS